MLKNIAILFLTLFFSQIFTQEKSGLLLDADTKEPITFVNVAYQEKNIGAISDEKGYYFLPFCRDCENVIISCIGYETKYIHKDSLFRIDTILLQAKNIILDEVPIIPLTISQIIQRAYQVVDSSVMLTNSTFFLKQFKKANDEVLLAIAGNGILLSEAEQNSFYLNKDYLFTVKSNFNISQDYVSNPYVKNAIDNLNIKNFFKWLIANRGMYEKEEYNISEFNGNMIYEIEISYDKDKENISFVLFIDVTNYHVVRIDINRFLLKKKSEILSSGKILYRYFNGQVFPSLLQTKIKYSDKKNSSSNFEDTIDIIFKNHSIPLTKKLQLSNFIQINQMLPIYSQINERYTDKYDRLIFGYNKQDE